MNYGAASIVNQTDAIRIHHSYFNYLRQIKISMKLVGRIITGITFLLFSCDKSDPSPQGPNEPAIFSCSPVEKSEIDYILSLGWIQPSGHTIPTSHIYFWTSRTQSDPSPLVYAPGSGVITKVLVVPVMNVPEVKIWVRMNDNFMYHLDHIVLDETLEEGSHVQAGQVIGTIGWGPSIDFGVIDNDVLNDFANPQRYNDEHLHCGKPLTYFADSLKSSLYSKVDREGDDKDGRVNVDEPGRLVGNWFLDDGTFYTDGPGGWDKELSFAFDIQRPTKVLVSIGGTIGLTGKWSIPTDAILPEEVSVSTGKVVYRLLYIEGQTQAGLMIVQMLDNDHIRIQVFPGSQEANADFTIQAKTYAR